jgi:hypothetical protein
MGMNIKDPQAHSMAQELAALTGQSLTAAVKMALQQALTQLKTNQMVSEPRPLVERLNEIAQPPCQTMTTAAQTKSWATAKMDCPANGD